MKAHGFKKPPHEMGNFFRVPNPGFFKFLGAHFFQKRSPNPFARTYGEVAEGPDPFCLGGRKLVGNGPP
jgi:hypothetical protein